MRVRRMIDHGGTGRNSFFEKDTVRASVAFLAQDVGTKRLVYCFYTRLYSLTGPGQAPEGRDRGNFFYRGGRKLGPGGGKIALRRCVDATTPFLSVGAHQRLPGQGGQNPGTPDTKRPATRGAGLGLAGGRGFEPRLTESESAVLPLDDPPKGDGGGLFL